MKWLSKQGLKLIFFDISIHFAEGRAGQYVDITLSSWYQTIYKAGSGKGTGNLYLSMSTVTLLKYDSITSKTTGIKIILKWKYKVIFSNTTLSFSYI